MRICFICEGSYPYIAGGVSSWIQMMITGMPDIEFCIWSIATNRKDMGEYKYSFPDNIKEISTVYLEDMKFNKKNKQKKLNKKDYRTLEAFLIDGDEVNWCEILLFLNKHRERLTSIIMGKDFYKIVVQLYQKSYSRTTFSLFLWNMRSMYLSLMYILANDVPQADVYHSVSTGYAGVLGSIASLLHNKPHLLTEHGIYTREREEEIIKSDWVVGVFKELWIDFFVKLSLISYTQAEKVLTLFKTNKSLQIELGCPEDKIVIIPNGIDYDRYKKLPRRYNQINDTIHVGIVARVVPIKDIKTALLAFDLAKKDNEKLKLIILGPYDEDKEYYEECLMMIKDMNMEDVIFEGRVNVPEYLPKIDIMLLSSISEGQPLSTLEGMAAGIPQVSTNVGSCSELILGSEEDHLGPAGIIVPVMNINAIAQAILLLSRDSKLRKEMGEIGCIRAEKYYRKESFIEQYHQIYQEYGGSLWQG